MAQLLYFGRLSDVTGTGQENVDLPLNVTSTASLRLWLDAKYEADGALTDRSVRLALNNEFCIEPAEIADGDEIAFMPPVGGG